MVRGVGQMVAKPVSERTAERVVIVADHASCRCVQLAGEQVVQPGDIGIVRLCGNVVVNGGAAVFRLSMLVAVAR